MSFFFDESLLSYFVVCIASRFPLPYYVVEGFAVRKNLPSAMSILPADHEK